LVERADERHDPRAIREDRDPPLDHRRIFALSPGPRLRELLKTGEQLAPAMAHGEHVEELDELADRLERLALGLLAPEHVEKDREHPRDTVALEIPLLLEADPVDLARIDVGDRARGRDVEQIEVVDRLLSDLFEGEEILLADRHPAHDVVR